MKRLFAVVLVLLLVVGGGVAGVLYFNPAGLGTKLRGLLSQAASELGAWVAAEATRVGQTYIEPTIAYDSFTYTPPGRLELKGFTLTAQDGTEVVRAGVATLILAEVPKLNQPIVIEEIILKDAKLKLIQTTDASGAPSGFKGLVPFLKGENVKDQDSVPSGTKLSEVFQIRRLALENAGIVYDLGDGSDPMVIDDITMETGVKPSDNPALYGLDLDLDRQPVFGVKLAGELDIDAMTLALDDFGLDLKMDKDGLRVLPPQIQSIFKEHDAQGRMKVAVSGNVPLTAPLTAGLQGQVDLNDFNYAVGEYRFPIDTASVPFNMSSGTLTSDRITVNTIDGVFKVMGLNLKVDSPAMPVSASWSGENLQVRNLLRAQPGAGKVPDLAGKLVTQGQAQTRLSDPMANMSGSGSFALTEGRLVRIPLVSQLAELMDVVSILQKDAKLVDTFDGTFNLTGQGVDFSQINLSTPGFSARGEGLVYYDGRLDLLLNAGPLEAVQKKLGDVGKLLGGATDSLIKYGVTGDVGNPQVKVKPLGL